MSTQAEICPFYEECEKTKIPRICETSNCQYCSIYQLIEKRNKKNNGK